MVEQESRKKRMSKEHKIQSMIEEEEMHELKELSDSAELNEYSMRFNSSENGSA
eukprot:CAMPEP_0176348886 /NCGR_PEP_ID=MMETSP0126-20121128/8233_1 /TAXON_ID=141414 ORGANISM="Strombidinopsis acuminatum, Strain SPMC142" /NCGR_SAMPLE_ID=MMETSP0126 /ASSEMBLY_ACC=CAM_ASM_000229 /LENGTH=53 /DNA_ID=CAMNT_0017697965 /DNA_START=316 /DNA_END=477 /DNA_ORIENTATION=+